MESNGIHIRVARCSECSLNADTAMFGYFLSVNNCNEVYRKNGDKNYTTHTCDVAINNRNSRYECKQIESISDCIDRLSYCLDPTFKDPDNKDLEKFCDSVVVEGETHQEFGDKSYYILDGHVLWNLQMEISKCGTSRTSTRNSDGFSWPTDQQPNCFPYSEVFMDNGPFDGKVMKCPSGETTMVETVCNRNSGFDYQCNPESYAVADCCISSSNCSSTVLGCEALRDTGAKICGDLGTENMKQCGNPCASIINIPPLKDGTEDALWKSDICEFFCPDISVQNYWFGNPDSSDNYEDSKIAGNSEDRYKSRICSEEYFNLCRLSGCTPSSTCKVRWGKEEGQQHRDYPKLYPHVHIK